MVFHWSLGDSKSPRVSMTILADLNNAVVWMHLIPTLLLLFTPGEFFTLALADGYSQEFE